MGNQVGLCLEAPAIAQQGSSASASADTRQQQQQQSSSSSSSSAYRSVVALWEVSMVNGLSVSCVPMTVRQNIEFDARSCYIILHVYRVGGVGALKSGGGGGGGGGGGAASASSPYAAKLSRSLAEKPSLLELLQRCTRLLNHRTLGSVFAGFASDMPSLEFLMGGSAGAGNGAGGSDPLMHDVYTWNGLEAHPLCRAAVLTRSFEVEKFALSQSHRGARIVFEHSSVVPLSSVFAIDIPESSAAAPDAVARLAEHNHLFRSIYYAAPALTPAPGKHDAGAAGVATAGAAARVRVPNGADSSNWFFKPIGADSTQYDVLKRDFFDMLRNVRSPAGSPARPPPRPGADTPARTGEAAGAGLAPTVTAPGGAQAGRVAVPMLALGPRLGAAGSPSALATAAMLPPQPPQQHADGAASLPSSGRASAGAGGASATSRSSQSSGSGRRRERVRADDGDGDEPSRTRVAAASMETGAPQRVPPLAFGAAGGRMALPLAGLSNLRDTQQPHPQTLPQQHEQVSQAAGQPPSSTRRPPSGRDSVPGSDDDPDVTQSSRSQPMSASALSSERKRTRAGVPGLNLGGVPQRQQQGQGVSSQHTSSARSAQQDDDNDVDFDEAERSAAVAAAVSASAAAPKSSERPTLSADVLATLKVRAPVPSQLARVGSGAEPAPWDDPQMSEGNRRALKMRYFDKQCSQVLDHLFVGSETVAGDRDLLLRSGITHVINVAAITVPNFFPETFTYSSFAVADASSVDMTALLIKCIAIIEEHRYKGGRVFVHCHQGVSRSCSLCIGYVMHINRWDFQRAFEYVRECRGVCSPNPGFIGQLLEWQAMRNEPLSMPRVFRVVPHAALGILSYLAQLQRHSVRSLDPRFAYVVRTQDAMLVWRAPQGDGEHGAVAPPPAMTEAAELACDWMIVYGMAPAAHTVVSAGAEPDAFWAALGAHNARVSVFEDDDEAEAEGEGASATRGIAGDGASRGALPVAIDSDLDSYVEAYADAAAGHAHAPAAGSVDYPALRPSAQRGDDGGDRNDGRDVDDDDDDYDDDDDDDDIDDAYNDTGRASGSARVGSSAAGAAAPGLRLVPGVSLGTAARPGVPGLSLALGGRGADATVPPSSAEQGASAGSSARGDDDSEEASARGDRFKPLLLTVPELESLTMFDSDDLDPEHAFVLTDLTGNVRIWMGSEFDVPDEGVDDWSEALRQRVVSMYPKHVCAQPRVTIELMDEESDDFFDQFPDG